MWEKSDYRTLLKQPFLAQFLFTIFLLKIAFILLFKNCITPVLFALMISFESSEMGPLRPPPPPPSSRCPAATEHNCDCDCSAINQTQSKSPHFISYICRVCVVFGAEPVVFVVICLLIILFSCVVFLSLYLFLFPSSSLARALYKVRREPRVVSRKMRFFWFRSLWPITHTHNSTYI